MRKPYIDIYLNLGFIGLKTEIMHERFDRDEFTYFDIRWSFFKWGGKFRLYRRKDGR